MTEEQKDNGSGTDQEEEAKNWLEWSFVIGGALVILGLFGYLVWGMTDQKSEPPDLVPRILESSTVDGVTKYRVEVRNRGGTAENVRIEVCDATDSCSPHTFRFVPLDSSREAVILMEDPRLPVVARIAAYEEM